jgi:hypothetical protein
MAQIPILVARSAALSAISLPVMPVWGGIHISSMFLEIDFNTSWIFWVISFVG